MNSRPTPTPHLDDPAENIALTPSGAAEYRLTPVEIDAPRVNELLAYEETIDRIYVKGNFQVGVILGKIRDESLYQSTHDTFADYLADRWGWSYSHVHRIIDAAIVVENLSTSPIGEVVLPTAESQVRPLVRLKDADKQRAAWKMAVKIAGRRVPTAEQVKAAILEIDPPPPRGDRRAKSIASAPILAQTAPHDLGGGNRNTPPVSDDTDTRDRIDGEGQGVVELTPESTYVVGDEDEASRDADALPPTLKLTSTVGPEMGVLGRTEDDTVDDTDNDGIGGRNTSVIPGPESNPPEQLRNTGDAVELNRHENHELPAHEVYRFVLADGSEIFSAFVADGDEIAPQAVQSALDVAGRRSTFATTAKVTSQQRAVVFLAEYVNQAIKAKNTLRALEVLFSIGSALALLQGLSKKKAAKT